MSSSPSGTSSGSSLLQNSDEVFVTLNDQRKRKRMLSNRESARRSRLRKQKHLDDLLAQVSGLRKENHQILNGINIAAQYFVNIEADNSVLRAQLGELSHRLQSLNEIVGFFHVGAGSEILEHSAFSLHQPIDCLFNPLNLGCFSQPIVASADMF